MRVARQTTLAFLLALAACGESGLTDPFGSDLPTINPAVADPSIVGLQVNITGLPDLDPSPDGEFLVFSPNGDGQLESVTLSLGAAGPSVQEAPRLFIRQGDLVTGSIAAGWGFSNYATPPAFKVLGVVVWTAAGKPEGEYRARGWSLQSPEGDAAPPRMVRLLVDRTPPTVSDLALPATEVGTGSSVPVTALATDALSPISEAQVQIGDGAWLPLSAVDGGFDGLTETVGGNFTAPEPGSYVVCVRARDLGRSWSGTSCGTLNVGEQVNQSPTDDAGGPWSGDEGSAVAISGSGNDPDGGSVSYGWSASDPKCSIASPTSAATTVTCSDNGNYTLTLTITDDESTVATDQASLTVTNLPPQVSITSPVSGTSFPLMNGALSVVASYSDPSSADTHTCTVSLNSTPEVVSGPNPVVGGSCNASIVPPQAGSYVLTVRVRDDDGAEGTASVNIDVTGSRAGLVTGGGWAYAPDGRVNFAINARYEEGAALPRGNTEVLLQGPKFRFQSAEYHWLTVDPDSKGAQFTGLGRVNGVSGYHFTIWVTSGRPGNPASFRLKIWGADEASVLYQTAEAPVAGGAITIHR